jgi:hypothetical protein
MEVPSNSKVVDLTVCAGASRLRSKAKRSTSAGVSPSSVAVAGTCLRAGRTPDVLLSTRSLCVIVSCTGAPTLALVEYAKLHVHFKVRADAATRTDERANAACLEVQTSMDAGARAQSESAEDAFNWHDSTSSACF